MSSSQFQQQPPDNHTIQGFVKDYVDEYIGKYFVLWHEIFPASAKMTNITFSLLFLSSSQPQARLPDNRTIINLVKDYLEEFVGRYTVVFHATCYDYVFLFSIF